MENLTDKSEKATSTSVAIEGATIRTIRETKKLTQLYVASVVGVTTDTISRWENNRYPTIKRDNAEKLATALEVSIDEIIRQEAASPMVEEYQMQPVKKKHRRPLLVMLLILIALVAYFFVQRVSAPSVAVRWAPHYSAPGDVLPVQIMVNRTDNPGRGFIIKEKLPPGWRLLTAIPPAASGNTSSEEIKWLVPGGNAPVKISYVVQLPKNAGVNTRAELRGTILLDQGGINRAETIGGSTSVTIKPVHWADSNGDGRIDDNEIMPAYYRTEEMKGLGLDWTRIEAIWSGKGYAWNSDLKSFEVIK